MHAASPSRPAKPVQYGNRGVPAAGAAAGRVARASRSRCGGSRKSRTIRRRFPNVSVQADLGQRRNRDRDPGFPAAAAFLIRLEAALWRDRHRLRSCASPAMPGPQAFMSTGDQDDRRPGQGGMNPDIQRRSPRKTIGAVAHSAKFFGDTLRAVIFRHDVADQALPAECRRTPIAGPPPLPRSPGLTPERRGARVQASSGSGQSAGCSMPTRPAKLPSASTAKMP